MIKAFFTSYLILLWSYIYINVPVNFTKQFSFIPHITRYLCCTTCSFFFIKYSITCLLSGFCWLAASWFLRDVFSLNLVISQITTSPGIFLLQGAIYLTWWCHLRAFCYSAKEIDEGACVWQEKGDREKEHPYTSSVSPSHTPVSSISVPLQW